MTRRGHLGNRSFPEAASRHRVDPEHGPRPGMDGMVADNERPVVEGHGPVKIVKNEEPRKMNRGIPEGVRNPGIQVCIRLRGRIIRNHRRAVIVVIIVHDLRIRG